MLDKNLVLNGEEVKQLYFHLSQEEDLPDDVNRLFLRLEQLLYSELSVSQVEALRRQFQEKKKVLS